MTLVQIRSGTINSFGSVQKLGSRKIVIFHLGRGWSWMINHAILNYALITPFYSLTAGSAGQFSTAHFDDSFTLTSVLLSVPSWHWKSPWGSSSNGGCWCLRIGFPDPGNNKNHEPPVPGHSNLKPLIIIITDAPRTGCCQQRFSRLRAARHSFRGCR